MRVNLVDDVRGRATTVYSMPSKLVTIKSPKASPHSISTTIRMLKANYQASFSIRQLSSEFPLPTDA